jgi:hypothetical protein
MSTNEGTTEKWRKFLLPGAASVLGAGAGLVLTRTGKLRDALPNLNDGGISDLADDLRTKLSSVVGGGDSNNSNERSSGSGSQTRATLEGEELQKRLKQRQDRRKQRAGR